MFLQTITKKLFFIGILFFACITGAIFFMLANKCIDFSVLENYSPGKPSIVLDDTGKEWARFALDKRKFVSLDQMSVNIKHAFLATEDRMFYEHYGLSIRGIVRSLLVNLSRGKKVQGASTITQQLVRLLFFDAKKTFKRKIKEQLFALLVEFQFTKDQILETYLNHVYFGHGIYGVQAAAQRFWNKDAQDLSLDEAAVLAGLVRAPTYYSPINSPQNAQKRRNVVLRLMCNHGFIDEQSCKDAQLKPLKIENIEVDVIALHLKEMIRVFLEDIFGKQLLYTGGLTIQTTINIDVQKAAEKSFHDHIDLLRNNLSDQVDGALVTITPFTGEIKALVGGYDFAISQFNRVTQAKRQMGSIFKTFVYAAAIEQGASFIDVEVDEPFELRNGNQIWRPQNNTNEFYGQMTLARALSYSNNIITIKTLLRAGIDHVIDLARRVFITADIPAYPSIALGCVETNVLETIGAFNVFANSGVYVQPHYIRFVKDKLGVKIYKQTIVKKQAIESCVAGQVLKVLTLGIHRLRKTIADKWFGGDAAGKTGTTNDSRTCWFCGSTPDFTTAVFIGRDDNQPLGSKVYGSRVAFPIWFKFMKEVVHEKKYFYYDPKLQEVTVDSVTGAFCYDMRNPERISCLICPS
ncbi:MAG: transglycosylase domain-containing protein [Candidatus Chromulinivorax sp.]